MIECKNLSLKRGDRGILSSVNFSLKNGSFCSLVGANGAGKSTLLNAILGFLEYEGEVILGGMNIKSYSKKAISQKISYMPQHINPPFMSVFDVLLSGFNPYVALFPSRHIKSLVQEFAKGVGLSEFLDRNIETLSGGEVQRVMLSKTIIKNPSLIILDEPISHLDPKHQKESLEFLKEYSQKNGTTVIAVLHDINWALRISDTLIGLKEGSVAFVKSSDDVQREDISRLYEIECELLRSDDKKFVYY